MAEADIDEADLEAPLSIQRPIKGYAPLRIGRDGIAPAERKVAAEVPVSITYNGLAHAVMMTTPQDLEDFVTGFTLSEAIVESADEIESIDVRGIAGGGYLAALRVPKERFSAVMAGRRNIVGQSGCGICGIIELENLVRPARPLPAPRKVTPSVLFKCLEDLRRHQPLNAATGAVHAAAFVKDGAIIACREDVGRHNALDKLIGHLARIRQPAAEGFVLLSSRCSFELVQKTALAGAPMLVTISAPTSFAADLARKLGLTMIALARSDSMLCFNDPHALFPAD
jgi:FdhD protein